MRLYDAESASDVRPRFLMGAFCAGLVFLWGMLGRVQLVEASRYTADYARQVTRRVCLPGPRGKMFDRNGYCLAANAPSYCICIHVEEICDPRWSRRQSVDRLQEVVAGLGRVLGRERFYDAPTREDIEHHMQVRSVMPLLIWVDVDHGTMARWAERNTEFPGVDTIALPRRHYFLSSKGWSIRGAVGRRNPPQDPDRPYQFCLPDMVGLWGLERACNPRLTGTPGELVISVDVWGCKRHVQSSVKAIPGQDITLTIDIRLQCLCELALRGVRGAIVIMDPYTGDILAMASSPAPRLGATPEEWRAYFEDPDRPLVDRSVFECFFPGSLFKPVVALAGLKNDLWDPETEVHCPGYHQVGNRRVRCWRRYGHGTLNLRQAIERSCNVYFCEMARHCGVDAIREQAIEVGFGEPTGIQPAIAESAGVVPWPEWKREIHDEPWTEGDTCNLALGQGDTKITVVQAARYISALANGGVLYHPRLVLDGSPPSIDRVIEWAQDDIALLHAGMEDVIHGEKGTGRAARQDGIRSCGKTGTAEHGPRGARRKQTWMGFFAPAENPRYAVAMVIEDGDSGGKTVAPRLGELMTRVFSQEIVPEMEVFAHVGVGRKLRNAN